MWRVATEAYAYLAGHPFLTDTVSRNRKTDNDRQIINKQHAAAEINQYTNQHNKQKQHKYQLQYLINKLATIFESKYILSLPLDDFRHPFLKNWWYRISQNTSSMLNSSLANWFLDSGLTHLESEYHGSLRTTADWSVGGLLHWGINM